ncbi:MAG TPA: GntR family transcriptional regulator [Stellaceae bacterium]
MSQTISTYNSIRDAILSVELMPGEPLRERLLETRFDSSRTPIRAALLRLETEGLVQRQGRSYVVAPIDISEIEQACEYREVIEVAAIRAAAERASGTDIDAIESMIHIPEDQAVEESYSIATLFHVELARLSGNAFFVRSLEDVLTRLSRARWLEINSRGGRERAFAEHQGVLNLIRQGRGDAAADEIRTHLTRSRDRLLDTLRTERRGLRARRIALVSG